MRAEIAAALFDVALMPPRLAAYLVRRKELAAEVRRDLASGGDLDVAPPCAPPRDRPLSLFVACAEVSGEIHLINAIEALRERLRAAGAPPPRLVGLGSRTLAGAGVEIVGDPVSNARMGLTGVLRAVPYYANLLRDCAAAFERERFDALFAVDSPALHVPLARIAHRFGVPTVHFVAPQYWGWAPWRTPRYRDAFDLSLTILPFERAWFERRGVHVAHVGHPLLDELEHVPRAMRDAPDGPLVLLPGSRRGVVQRNFGWMLRGAERARERFAGLEIVVAQARNDLEPLLRDEIERAGLRDRVRLAFGSLHRELERARAVLSVSGTVLLDVLHHRVPCVVVYRLEHQAEAFGKDHLLTVPYFSSINLLAGNEVVPEFCFAGDGPRKAIDAALAGALGDPEWRARCRAGLDRAALRLGPPGACDRAAAHLLALVAPKDPA